MDTNLHSPNEQRSPLSPPELVPPTSDHIGRDDADNHEEDHDIEPNAKNEDFSVDLAVNAESLVAYAGGSSDNESTGRKESYFGTLPRELPVGKLKDDSLFNHISEVSAAQSVQPQISHSTGTPQYVTSVPLANKNGFSDMASDESPSSQTGGPPVATDILSPILNAVNVFDNIRNRPKSDLGSARFDDMDTTTRLRRRNKSDNPGERLRGPRDLAQLWSQAGGPPVGILGTPSHPSHQHKTTQPQIREGGEDSDHAEDEPGVFIDLSVRLDMNVIPTSDGFQKQIQSLNPHISTLILDRFIREQLKRYKRLVDIKIQHEKSIQKGKCATGLLCIGQGGQPQILPLKPSGQAADSVPVVFQIIPPGNILNSQELKDDNQAAQFPQGIPLPPVYSLPAKFECPYCFEVKEFDKPSDWKKHIHEDVQPFTCTFPDCEAKSFKRKSDWVRHESEKHRQLESWTCAFYDCAHVSYRRDDFVQHLVRQHQVPEPRIYTRSRTASSSYTPSTAHSSYTTANFGLGPIRFNSEDEFNDLFHRLVFACYQESNKNALDEPCRFCGIVCKTFKKLTVHLAKHMEQIAIPIIPLIEQYPATWDQASKLTQQSTEAPWTDTNHEMKDEWERKQKDLMSQYPLNPEHLQAGPPTDSGYASTFQGKSINLQKPSANSPVNINGGVQQQVPIDVVEGSTSYTQPEHLADPDKTETDDVQTVYSEALTLQHSMNEGYITEMADTLFNKVDSADLDGDSVKRLARILPILLKDFALQIGHNARNRKYLDVMQFVHRFRSKIAKTFQERYDDSHSHSSHKFKSAQVEEMTWKDLVRNWIRNLEQPEKDVNPSSKHVDELELMDDDDSSGDLQSEESHGEPDVTNISGYRGLIHKTAAYHWLLAMLQRELNLISAEPNIVEDIRRKIIASLPPVGEVSRKNPPDSITTTYIVVGWDPASFITEQNYDEDRDYAIENAITLTGSATNAQALTSGQYLLQTWPLTGRHVMRLVKAVILNTSDHRCTNEILNGETLSSWTQDGSFFVEVNGTRNTIAEIGEQLAWLGSSLRSSPYDVGAAYCTPRIRCLRSFNDTKCPVDMKNPPGLFFEIDFTIIQTEEDINIENGKCWQSMFRNPVIVVGYPIPRRPQYSTGLDVPLDLMASLVQEQRLSTFHGNILIKGFSSMLVATKIVDNSVIWHHLFNADGSHIPYADAIYKVNKDLDEDIWRLLIPELQSYRHIVGWCPEAKCYAGTPLANYDIKLSRLPRPHAGCYLEKISITAGHFISASVTAALGQKDRPFHIRPFHLKPKPTYISRLRWIASRFIVLYDVGDRRGWLVDGASAVLHLVRASFLHDQKDALKSEFLLKPEELEEPHQDINSRSKDVAMRVLASEHNRLLKLYEETGDLVIEEYTRADGTRERVERKTMTCLLFKDRVQDICHLLELVLAHQDKAATDAGKRLRISPSRQLEGFDFSEIASEEPVIRSRVTTLDATGKGWIDLISAIDAMTLFGRGFGDLIQPVGDICRGWAQAPCDRGYLSASVNDISEIMDQRGSTTTIPWQLVDELYWNPPDTLLKECMCHDNGQGKHANKIQILTDGSWKFQNLFKERKAPKTLGSRGAIIFGHSGKLPLRQGENRDLPTHPAPENSSSSGPSEAITNSTQLLTSDTTQGSNSILASTDTRQSAAESSRTSLSLDNSLDSTLSPVAESQSSNVRSSSAENPSSHQTAGISAPEGSSTNRKKRGRFGMDMLPLLKRPKKS